MATLVGIVSLVINVAVSFMSDGNWKTAGTGLAQLYWNRTNRSKVPPEKAVQPTGPGFLRPAWVAQRSIARAA
jgi:hypothetical protein